MKYIAILRGINVGGKRKILMKELIETLEESSFYNVQTYIQSGNVIFESLEKNTLILEEKIAILIYDKYGFEVPVIVREKEAYKKIVEENPLEKNMEKLHLTFLKTTPSKTLQDVVQKYTCEPDYFKMSDQHIYIHCEGKYHQTKLSNTFFEKKLKTSATTRNWKTVLKIYELLG